MKITIQTFGAFRQFGRHLELDLADKAVVADIRAPLVKKLIGIEVSFSVSDLIESSRFATDVQILNEGYNLSDGQIITILPPVSGG